MKIQSILSESLSSIKFLGLPLEVSLPFSFILLYSPAFLENLPPFSPGFLTFYGYSSRLFLSSTTFLTSFRLQNSHAQFFLPLQADSFLLWAWLFPHSGTFHFSGLFHPSFLFLCLPISFLWNPYLSSLALLFIYDILSFLDPFSFLFTVIVRTFLFRKLIKLVFPHFYISAPAESFALFSSFLSWAGFLFVLPLLWHIFFSFLAPAFPIIHFFLSILTMFHSKQAWSRTLDTILFMD